jgi:hypothetical protein
LAETTGDTTKAGGKIGRMTKLRDPKRIDRLREVWALLFTHPEIVAFEPYCTKR